MSLFPHSQGSNTTFVAVYAPDSYGLGDFLMQRSLPIAAFCNSHNYTFSLNFYNHPALRPLLSGTNCDVLETAMLTHHSCLQSVLASGDYFNKTTYLQMNGKFGRVELPLELRSYLNCCSDTIAGSLIYPSEALLERIASRMRALSLVMGQYISIHVRAGDGHMTIPRNDDHFLWQEHWMSRVQRIVERYGSRSRLVLHCDSPLIKQRLLTHFPLVSCTEVAALHFGVIESSSFDIDSAAETLLDLYIMALSSRICRTSSRSSFPRLAEALAPSATQQLAPFLS